MGNLSNICEDIGVNDFTEFLGMKPAFMSEIFNNYKQIDFFISGGEDLPIDGKNIKFYLTDDLISPKVKAVFDNLFSCLNIGANERPTNYGAVLFDIDTYEHKYTAYPAIGLNTNQELVLRIGSTNENDEETGLDIPLFFNGQCYFLKMLNSEKMLKLDIQPVVVGQGTPDEKTLYYLAAKEESRPKYTFVIPFRMKEKTEIDVLTECWYSGKFELCCKGFSKTGMNMTHAFVNTLQDGSFPQSGVLLILKDGYYDEFFDQAKGKTYQSTKWEIVGVSHPNLLVTSYSDGIVPLSSVGQLSASAACAATKCFLESFERLGRPDNFTMPLYLLHVTGVNTQFNKPRLDWQPKNNGFLRLTTISPLVKRNFGMFLQEMKPMIDEIIANVNSTAVKPSSVAKAVTSTDEDEDEFSEQLAAF